MRAQKITLPPTIRRMTAALLVLVLSLASLLGTFNSASASNSGPREISEWSGSTTAAPKPCKRAVLPGAVNTCPFAGLSLTAVPANESDTVRPFPAVQVVTWRPHNDVLPAQCNASSPYRPPSHIS